MFRSPMICLDAPCIFGHPYVWTPSCMFGCPHIFGCLPVCLGTPYAWILDALVCLDTPLCLDASHIFGCPPVCLDDVWMPLYIHNTKKACFVRLRGCLYALIHLDAPYVWMHSLYVWMPPYVWIPPYVWLSLCLDTPICLDTPMCLDVPHTFGCPIHLGAPNIQGTVKHM